MAGHVRIRPYDPAIDQSTIEFLWRSAIAPTWPLLPNAMDLVRAGFVAIDGNAEPVGFVAVDVAGSIPLLMVAPNHQRRGVGTLLLRTALGYLGAAGTGTVSAGSGGEGYIWPGVPLDLPAAVAFFVAHGWDSDYDCLDLALDLRGFRPPPGIYERSKRIGVVIAVATEDDLGAVMAFESANFPQWARWFHGDNGDVLIARDAGGRIVGTMLYDSRDSGMYEPMLGPRAGTIGCVGVAPDLHNQGVGSAMIARGSEILRDAGTHACHIGWAVRESFYGRVGFRRWRRYRMFSSSVG